MTSFLTTELKYPGIPFGIIEKIKNKYNFRSLCVDLEINSPRFFSIKSSERKEFLSKITKNNTVENDSFFEKCTFPIIVKNTYGCGKG
jgi:carbamoylphosphate synthase large subunit